MVGDEIVAINQKVVSDANDARRLLRKSGPSLTITLRKMGKLLFISLDSM